MPPLRFGGFELDPDAGELRKDGELVKIQPQPAKVLAILASRAGSLVTREELRSAIWGVQTFVDFDRSLNFAVAHIRAVLRDSAETPRLIQTVPRRGYRFIGTVEHTAPVDAAAAGHNGSAADIRKSFRPFVAVCLTATLVFVLVSSLIVSFARRSDNPNKSPVAGANQAFVEGQYLLRKATRHDLNRALDRFKRAAVLDSGFTEAHAAIAETSWFLILAGARPHELFPAAKEAALTAVRLNPDSANARAALGNVRLWYDWDLASAEREFKQAVESDSSLASAHHGLGWTLIALRRFDHGIQAMRRAEQLDPLSPRAVTEVGWALLRAGRYSEAVEQSRRALDLEPDFVEAHGCLELALKLDGKPVEAATVAARRLARSGTTPATAKRTNPYALASDFAASGQKSEALKWLQQALEERNPMMVMVALDPVFATLRDVPDFLDLLRQISAS